MPMPKHATPPASPEDEGRALLARAPVVSVVGISEAGEPRLCTAASALVDGDLHVRVGRELLGRRVVAGAHEHVATIDDTTYWLGARAEGMLEPAKSSSDEPADLAGVLARLRLDRVTSIVELGQATPLDERRQIVDRLWRRGRAGDAAAVASLLARFPELGTPSFLRPSADLDDRGFRLRCGLVGDDLDDVLDLLQELYWLQDLPRNDIRAAVVSSTALVACRDHDGRIVAFARAVSDGKCAWIYDVVVAAHLRGSHVGSAVMKVLLDHPSVRGVRHVRLTTRDAMPFYRRLGFRELAEAPRYAWTSTEMIRPGVARSERAAEPEAGRSVAEERIDAGLGQLAARS